MNTSNNTVMKPEVAYNLDEKQAYDYSAEFTIEGDGRGVLFIIEVDNACDLVIKGGDGVFGKPDLVLNFLPDMKYAFFLETGGYVQTTGEKKGMILMSGSETFKINPIMLA